MLDATKEANRNEQMCRKQLEGEIWSSLETPDGSKVHEVIAELACTAPLATAVAERRPQLVGSGITCRLRNGAEEG